MHVAKTHEDNLRMPVRMRLPGLFTFGLLHNTFSIASDEEELCRGPF
jgi:hypothetical protein